MTVAPDARIDLLATGFQLSDIALIAVIVVLLAMSAVLALAETSLVRTSRVRAKALLAEHRRGSRRLLRLVEHPEQFLNTVLLLVLVGQLVSATLVGILANAWFGAFGVLVAVVFEVVVIFVLAEAVPKNWAVQNPDRAALFSAPLVAAVVALPPLRALSAVLVGFADLLIGRRSDDGPSVAGHVTESEIRAMADVAMDEEVIEIQERAFIHSIIDFGDAVVRGVMVPRPDMVTLDAGTTVSDALGAAIASGHSRLPAYQEHADDVVGIAYTMDLVRAEREGGGEDPVRSHVRPPRFVPETKRLSGLLREMQEAKFHMALVVDEYGSTAGLVTLEDLIEELVGEIVDEFDVEEPAVQRLADGSVVLSGRLPIGDVEEILGAELPQGTWDTLGGLVLDLAGHVPGTGEAVDVDGFHLVVQGVQGRRVGTVRVERTARASAMADGPEE